jgi:hypothetical protein
MECDFAEVETNDIANQQLAEGERIGQSESKICVWPFGNELPHFTGQ